MPSGSDKHIRLATSRVTLRRLTDADAENLFELDSDPEVIRYVHQPAPATVADVRSGSLARFRACEKTCPRLGFWAAIDNLTGEFMGWFHLRPWQGRVDELELGYRLKRSCWGRGLATEVSSALLTKAFDELGATRVMALTLAANRASIRVMEKLGMSRVASFTESGEPAVVYAVSKPTA